MKIEPSLGWQGLAVLIGLILVACQAPIPERGSPATVQRVVSGQTLEVTIAAEQPAFLERVRLAGITAPDLAQVPWGVQARDRLKTLLGDRASVRLELVGTDAYNRRRAYVWHQGKLLNETLVQQGYALAAGQFHPQYRDRLERAQDYARVMGYGIWNPAQPLRQTPDEYRRQQKQQPRTAKPAP